MKNVCWWIWCACCFLGIGCTDENSMIKEDGVYSFKAGFAPSDGRTVLQDGGKVIWKAGDAVEFWKSRGTLGRFEAMSDGATTLFMLKDPVVLDYNETFVAFYPADELSRYGSFEVKTVQTAIAGTFDPDAAICMAQVKLNGTAQFRNVCSLLKFRVPMVAIRNGVKAAELTTRSFKDKLFCGGIIDEDMNVTWNKTTEKYRLEGDFEYGKDYYLVLPPLTLNSGFEFTLLDKQGKQINDCSRYRKTAFETLASKQYDLGFIYDPYASTSWYTSAIAENPDTTQFFITYPRALLGLADILRNGVNVNGTTITETFAGKTISLGMNINMLEYSDAMHALENFAGIFDGKGFAINGLRLESDAVCLGLFSKLKEGAVIKNLVLENGEIVSTGKDSALEYQIGGLAGYAKGVVFENCHLRNFHVTHAGGGYVGGLVGNTGEKCRFIACSNAGNVSVMGNSSQQVSLGGLVNCTGSGNMMVACFVTGDVIGLGAKGNAGGLAGYLGDGNQVYGCYVKGNVSGTSSVGVLLGNASGRDTDLYNCYYMGSVNACGKDGGMVLNGVSTMAYPESVPYLNQGVELYNDATDIPCCYHFVKLQSPLLQWKDSNSPKWDKEEY